MAKTSKSSGKLPPAPGSGKAVNLAIAEIVLRGVADRMRGRVETDVSEAEAAKKATGSRDAVDGRSLITSVGLYGAARLAKKSRAGLGLVAGGLVAKSLYERGKAVRERRSKRRAE
jgi:hypothetical protein